MKNDHTVLMKTGTDSYFYMTQLLNMQLSYYQAGHNYLPPLPKQIPYKTPKEP